MTTAEFLLRRAEALWSQGHRLPIDLFYQLLNAGVDVDACERRFMEQLHG